MAIAIVHLIPGGSQEDYDKVVRELRGGSMERLSDWPVDGVLCHIAGPTEGGWQVVDVWEDEESFRRFGEKLKPAFEAAGVEMKEPQVYPVHKFIKE